MQARDVVAVTKKQRAVLVSVPVLATLAVLVVAVAQPKKYEATATVLAPAVVGGNTGVQYSGSNGVKSYVANFAAALTSAPVVRQVAAQTHVAPNGVKSAVSATQIGTSTGIRVTATTAKRRAAVPVARAAASVTIVSLFAQQVDLARQPLESANAALADVEQQMAALGSRSGLIVPDKDYEVRAQQIAGLETARADAASKGHASVAAALGTQIDQLKAQLSAIAPTVEQFTALQNEKNAAVVRVDDAAKALREDQSQLQAADPHQVVSVGNVASVPLLGPLVPKATVAALAGLFLAAGIVAALELLEAREPHPGSSGVAARPLREVTSGRFRSNVSSFTRP